MAPTPQRVASPPLATVGAEGGVKTIDWGEASSLNHLLSVLDVHSAGGGSGDTIEKVMNQADYLCSMLEILQLEYHPNQRQKSEQDEISREKEQALHYEFFFHS